MKTGLQFGGSICSPSVCCRSPGSMGRTPPGSRTSSRPSHGYRRPGAGQFGRGMGWFGRGQEMPSQYEVEMVVEGVRYAYHVDVNDSAVLYEGLYSYP